MIIADVGFMQVDVFEGGNGDLVFCQEHPHIDGEHYSRIITNMDNAEAICEAIMAAARKARAK